MSEKKTRDKLNMSFDQSLEGDDSCIGDDLKKTKRAAANVNERRRMQNINTGFEALRSFIDVPNKGKISKSAILRHAVDMIRNLQAENQQLREQNIFMRNLFTGCSQPNQLTCPLPNSSKKITELNNTLTCEDGNNNNNDTSSNDNNESKDNWSSIAEYVPTSKRQKVIHSPIKREQALNLLTPESDKTFTSLANETFTSSRSISFNSQPTTKVTSTPRHSLLDSPSKNLRSMSPLRVSPRRHNYNSPKRTVIQSPIRSRNTSNNNSNTFVTPAKYDPFTFLESPNTRSRRLFREQMLMTTPESGGKYPISTAKRSLDAIIQAIDQIEKS